MRTIVLATTACVTAVAQPARAQQAAPADNDPATVVVTGQRAQQQRAVDFKCEALGVIDVAASDEIGQLPDRNVAEVVERLPGVGVQYDQGEGRYVSVRGIPSALNQYTINGFEIGNPDGNSRRLPLDIVSGQLLNRVEVSKVKTPEQDGQGIGGLINLVTQTAFDFREPLVVQATAQAGVQELNDKIPLRGDVSIGGASAPIGHSECYSEQRRPISAIHQQRQRNNSSNSPRKPTIQDSHLLLWQSDGGHAYVLFRQRHATTAQ